MIEPLQRGASDSVARRPAPRTSAARSRINRLLLLAAFGVNLVSTIARPGYSASSLEGFLYNILEAAGMTLAAGLLPFLIGLKRPGLWHGWTLGFSLLAAFGEFYGG